jgi:N-acetylglucosaminyl-diphospho-decaprenol L-rhamnosyltransferase
VSAVADLAGSGPRPRLSIVIVNWNTRALLLRLLGELLPEGGPPMACEVIAVDNASSDDSAAAAAAAFPAAIVLRQPVNGGFAYGVNRGVEQARSEWVLLLNTDTEVSQAAITAFVAEAEKQPGAAVFGPRIVDERGAVQHSVWGRHRPWRHLLDALGLARLLDRAPRPGGAVDVDCVSGCVFLIRRIALERVGCFDERFFLYFEEADFCERVRRAGMRVRWLPATSFVHRGGLSAVQAAMRTFVAFRESCLLYHAAWHGRVATEFVRGCLLLASLLRMPLLRLAGRRDRARLHAAAVRYLCRPRLVKQLCRRARAVPKLTGASAATVHLRSRAPRT